MFFGFLTALISIGSGVLIIVVIVKGINRGQEIRQQTYLKTLESGVYDYRLLRDAPSSGTAALGWGIFFAGVGLALLVSFIVMGIFAEAIAGSLVPLFTGLALIAYYVIRRLTIKDEKQNGAPVTFAPPGGGRPAKIAPEE